MRNSQAPGLRNVIVQLSGTGFENRKDIIRTLDIGTKVRISPVKNDRDAEALGVFLGKKQIGWIPMDMNTAVHGLGCTHGFVTSIGTDTNGFWTVCLIRIEYDSDSPAGKVVAQYGLTVASVLHKMHVKDPRRAQRIAELPKSEQNFAIEEWNMGHMSDEGHTRKSK